jgi:outer membrane protein OmpA-like peptidoglycan-associated protein
MKITFFIISLFFLSCISAQDKKTETVYFNFDKYDLAVEQEQKIYGFVKKIDSSKVESVQIYGYCDDRGNYQYNYNLSNNRVQTVQNLLINYGFNKNKIIIVEGRGRVLIDKDSSANLEEIRSKNRRVDLMLIPKNSFGKRIYNSLMDKHEVGDRIYLEHILFQFGSSKLNSASLKELDKIAAILNKNKTLEFEIRGHVCCTPSHYNDAIDHSTNERKLSLNRAKNVFRYLMSKNINTLRMSYKGCGNKFPLGKGDKYDRRVEFLITKI